MSEATRTDGMTVGDLVRKLSALPVDAPVYLLWDEMGWWEPSQDMPTYSGPVAKVLTRGDAVVLTD